MPPKNRFFCPASLWPNIAESLSPQLRLPQLLSLNRTSHNPKSKNQCRAQRATSLQQQAQVAQAFRVDSPAAFPVGYSPTPALNPRPLPAPPMKISVSRMILPFRLTAQIRRVMKLLRSSSP
jgi:hypothetical protein